MSIQIGELRARLTAEASQMKQEIQAVKKELSALKEEGNKTSKSFVDLSGVMEKIGANTDQLKKIEAVLKNIDLGRLEKGLESIVQELRKMGVESKQVEKVEHELKQVANEAEKSEEAVNGVRGSMEGLGSVVATIGAGAGFVKLTSTIKALADEAQKLSMAYSGLSEVSKALNVDVEKSATLADELADRWGLSRTEMANTVKTYLTAGLTLEQTRDIMIATADAAVYNRESHLSWAEAIYQVAQGIKMGNSELTDAAGITTNLSVMQDRYAKSIGTTAAKLTEAQKIQAAYNGIISESAMFAGNADSAMTGYTGTQATFNQTMQEARVELGESFIPVLQDLMETLTPTIRHFALFADENKEVVAGVGAASVAFTGFIAIVGALTVTFNALKAAMGPWSLVLTALGALATGLGAYAFAAHSASEASKEFAKNQQELNAALATSPANITADQYQKMQKNIEQLNEVLEKRNELEKEYNDRLESAQSGQGSIENTQAMMELADQIRAVDKELKDMDYSNVDEAKASLDKMKEASKGALGALVDLTRSQMQQTVAQVDNVSQMKDLIKQYDELNKKEKLSEQQKAQLAEITKKLKAEYPDLLVQLDEENRWHIKNKEALDAYISGERNRVNAAADAAKRTLEIAKKEANERIRIAQETIDLIDKTEKDAKTAKKPDYVPQELYDSSTKLWGDTFNREKRRLTEQINTDRFNINEATKEIDALTVKDWDQFRAKPASATSGDKGKTKKTKSLAEIQQEDYQRSLKYIQYKRDMNQMTEQQELASLQKLEERYKKNGEIRMDVEVRIKKLKDQMADDEKKRIEEQKKKDEAAAKARYEASTEWITQEERRMTLAGKSEDEITQMKLEAWTRVRNRYEKDSEFYKQADTQVYNLKVSLMKAAEKAQEEAAKQQEQDAKDLLKTTTDAISKAKKAELDALDERRRAIEKFYDDQQEAIDESERQRERGSLLDEIAKYKNATSEAGQKHLQELQEKLRQMDVDDQKRALDKERTQKLEALDRQKEDIESWYDDLEQLIDDYKGNAIKLYQLLEDDRYKAFRATNDKIRTELQALIAEYAKLNGMSVPSAPSSGSSGGGGNSPSPSIPNGTLGSAAASAASSVKTSTIAKMQANSDAWKTASAAERKALEAANEKLGASIGATKNSGTGVWSDASGKPLYHTGGIAGVANFRSEDRLLPDELAAILRIGEPVLTPKQVGSLVTAGAGGGDTIHNYYGPLIEHSGDVLLEDEADIKTYNREQESLARKLYARGGRLDD
ncbi:hypothetical protein H7B90_00675 [Cohnella xylanilytica]|uniref:Uncharacterized protein n=1 Tax=Cohnella xylanilytica TaxID=557555 RepID=A0A841TP32_9BACL|nr:hypothetical protein [Cohnella xylanilytica]MBB6689905.1 hypothetical protein [Cohnella xylanilytica]